MSRRDDGLDLPVDVEARLRSIDDALPPSPPWHAPDEAVDRVRGAVTSRGRLRFGLPALALVVVVVAAALLLGRPIANNRAGSPAPAVIGSPAASALQTPSPAARPSAGPAIEVLRGGAAETAVIERLGWGACDLAGGDILRPVPNPDAIDAAADVAGIETGWRDVPLGAVRSSRMWLGDDVIALAIANGNRLVAISPSGDVWLAGDQVAWRWQPTRTPEGRTAWRQGDQNIAPTGSCASDPPRWLDVQGIRSFECEQLAREDCMATMDVARASQPSAFQPEVDVLALPECPLPFRCGPMRSSPPPVINNLIVVTRVPWRESADRVLYQVGSDGAHAIEPASNFGILRAFSRPSLPLQTHGTVGQAWPPECRVGTVIGTLHGDPWDARVAWVDDQQIDWPAGTTARFVPELELANEQGTVLAREGDPITVRAIPGTEPLQACGFSTSPSP